MNNVIIADTVEHFYMQIQKRLVWTINNIFLHKQILKTNYFLLSRTKATLDDMKEKYPSVDVFKYNVSADDNGLDVLVQNNDIAISLLTPDLHPKIARKCILHRRPMVQNTSLCEEMKHLHDDAQEAGITILTEIGLCPGIDHMMAKKCFDEVHSNKGRIHSFISWAGGLPAPECSNVPLRYKFSWHPLGVLNACFFNATFLRDGKLIEIPGKDLLCNVEKLKFFPGLNLEGFYNKNVLNYIPDWGIDDAKTVIRGRFRYKGFSDQFQGLVALNLMSPEKHPKLDPRGPDITWASFICDVLGSSPDIPTATLTNLVYDRVGKSDDRLQAIIDLGFLGDTFIEKKVTPLDTVSHYLAKKLSFQPNERDMVMIHNITDIQWPDGSRERRTANMTLYGNSNGHSAVAATTGLPTALATEIIVKGEYQERGVLLPVSPHIYGPILSKLNLEGIVAKEEAHTL